MLQDLARNGNVLFIWKYNSCDKRYIVCCHMFVFYLCWYRFKRCYIAFVCLFIYSYVCMYREASIYRSDVWSSPDGKTWTLVTIGCRNPQSEVIASGNSREGGHGSYSAKCRVRYCSLYYCWRQDNVVIKCYRVFIHVCCLHFSLTVIATLMRNLA